MPHITESIDGLIARELPPWLRGPQVEHLRALHAALRAQQECAERMRTLLEGVPALDAFAAPLLEQALQQAGLGAVDVGNAWVVMAQDVELPSAAPNLPKPRHTFHSRQSLLASALHNYREEEAQRSIFRRARLVDAQGVGLGFTFERFVRLCSALDLGGRYQRLLKQQLQPEGEAGRVVERLFEEQQRLQLEVEALTALLKGGLDERGYLHLVPFLTTSPVVAPLPEPVAARQLWLLGKPVQGVVTLEVRQLGGATVEAVIACIPGDPHGAVSRHGSWNALYQVLAQRLAEPGYRRFFGRFLGERDRAAFMASLARLRAAQPNATVELDGRNFVIAPPLLVHLRDARLSKILDDARVLAVPTDDEDAASRRERLHAYVAAGLDLLNLIGLFVPVLGELMLVVAAAQFGEELYEGYQDWQLGDRQAALDHLFNVAQTVVVGALAGKASGEAIQLTRRIPFVDGLAPVRTASGRLKLCAADLATYRVTADELGAGEYQSGRVRLHDGAYDAREDSAQGDWQLLHPQRADAHALRLEGNGAGGWRHELEQPQYWQGDGNLLRRLGSRLASLNDATAEALLQITGHTQAQLRQLHLENAVAPARLLDALERYALHEQFPALQGEAFEGYLAERSVVPDSRQAVLIRDFPGLSVRGAQEILEQANGAQLQQMQATQRVPLALAERARWYLRDVRLDRACAGLQQRQAVIADTERLAFGLVDALAPWPETVRIELRDGYAAGDLRVACGAATASDVRLIVKGRLGYRVMEGPGVDRSTPQDDLLQALALSFDASQSARLGDLRQLRERLALHAATHREQVADLLGLAPIGRGLRPPRRFADGRLGYALSGRGESSRQALEQGIRQVYPTLTNLQLDAYLRALRQQNVDPWTHYALLQDRLARLRTALQAWRADASGPFDVLRRRRVANAMRRSWRRKTTGGNGDYVLEIVGERVGSLPTLPDDIDFRHVRRLVLRDMDLADLQAGLLRRFGNLLELDLRHNRLTEIPADLEHLTQLRRVRLSHNRIVMDVEGNRRLGALRRAASVELDYNPLGHSPELGRLHHLRRLTLRATGLESVPEEQHVPWRALLDLRDNRIRQLRQDLHGLGRRLGLQRLSLHDNPLDSSSLQQLDGRVSPLSPGERGSASFEHAAVDALLRETMLRGARPERLVLRSALWERLMDEPEAADLFRFIADFVNTEDFRAAEDVYRGRIWRILEACEQHEDLRARVYAEAGGERTCEDRLLLVLSQLELAVLAEQAVLSGPPEQVEWRLLRLGRALYRLDAVDLIANAHVQRLRAGGAALVDEVETRLFYRVRLTPSLGLPMQPEIMHYEEYAGVSASDLLAAERQVLRGENLQVLVESLAQRPFWERFARERHAEHFEAMAEPFHQRLEAGLEQGANSAEYVTLAQRLRQELQEAEQQLLQTLAREAFDRSQPG
ncbi:NEL-type E3 ubiquitin ligase domain-containing protein [Pseudomonas sichuanensis]|uniref:NEL-type E3 ubiquitin ligase domain-containing protein n=1 Tax=Pseudomonas sichuanensis TaxID=2213015 RepID=UPI00381D7373